MTRVLVPSDIDPAGPAFGGRVHTLSGETMGTTWSVRFVGPAQVDLGDWRDRVEGVLEELVDAMSHWERGSELSRFNRTSPNAWLDVSPDLREVVQVGLDVARASGGAFDPTMGALVNRWGFGATGRFDQPGFVPPTPDEAAAARALGGWQRVEVDMRKGSLKQPGGLLLDLSGIGKGHAVDVLMDHLRDDDVRDLLVEVGGELRGHGVKPDGQPWWTSIARPPGAPASLPETRIALHGVAVATSGDYHRHYDTLQGRIAHTVDPRTGRPVDNGVVSCSVVHPSCTRADAWATALTVLGPDDGVAVADREGIAALWVIRQPDGTFVERWSRAVEDLLA